MRPQGQAGDSGSHCSGCEQRVRAWPENLQLHPEQTWLHLCRRGDGKRQELHEPVSSLTVIAPLVPLLLVRDASHPIPGCNPGSLYHFPLEIPPFSFSALSAQPKGAASCSARAGPGNGNGLTVPCAGKRLLHRGCPPVPALSGDASSTQRLGDEGNRWLHFTSEILGGQIAPRITESKLTALLSRAVQLVSQWWGFIGVWRWCKVRMWGKLDATFCKHHRSANTYHIHGDCVFIKLGAGWTGCLCLKPRGLAPSPSQGCCLPTYDHWSHYSPLIHTCGEAAVSSQHFLEGEFYAQN